MHVSPVLRRLSVQPPCRGAGDMADREVVPASLFMWNREHSARIRRGVTLPEWRPGKGADFEGHWGPPLTGGTPLNGAGPQGLCLTDVCVASILTLHIPSSLGLLPGSRRKPAP